MTSYIYNMVDTWNNGATTFTAIKMDVTDSASNAASLLMDLQVATASKFKVSKAGNISIADNGYISAIGSGRALLYFNSNNAIISDGPLGSTDRIGLASSTGNSTDAFLTRRAAANLRLGAADAAAPVAQKLSVQSVVAGTSNTAGGDLTITGSQSTGSGVGGSIIFQTAAANSGGGATVQNTLANAMVIDSVKTVRLGTGYTVATLPAAGTAGRRTYVTDATAPTFLGALIGGGAVVCPVFDNGTAWVSA